MLEKSSSADEAETLGPAGHWGELSGWKRELKVEYPPIAFRPAREKRAAARSAGVFEGRRRLGMGCGVGGSGDILKGVMNLRSPLGGPVDCAIFRGAGWRENG